MSELTAAEPRSAEQVEHDHAIDERLKMAYATAMYQQHNGARLEIHVGSDVVTYLKRLCTEIGGNFVPIMQLWGFPLIETTAAPDHISVHAVTTIPA